MARGAQVSVDAPVQDGWHPARLLPTVGLRSEQEKEARAASSLLAVMRAVPEFGRALVGELGGPRGRITTYTEIQLKDAAGKLHIPDGAIVAERGKSLWRCLVEVKTGSAALSGEQVNRYVDVARIHGFDAVLTISNQITSSVGERPVSVDGRKLMGRVGLFHLSWWRIITEAIVQHRYRGVADPDQAWLLGELIAYLDDEKSGASGFQDMGDKWVSVRNGAANGTLRAGDSEVRDVVVRWDQFVDYLCLGLGQDLGGDVRPVRPRKQPAEERLEAAAKRLETEGRLEAAFRVPDAVGPVTLAADLRTRRVGTSVAVDAPRTGRPITRVHWILRQLKQAPGDLRIEVSFANTRETSPALLSDARTEPERLLSSADPKRAPRTVPPGPLAPSGNQARQGREVLRTGYASAGRRLLPRAGTRPPGVAGTRAQAPRRAGNRCPDTSARPATLQRRRTRPGRGPVTTRAPGDCFAMRPRAAPRRDWRNSQSQWWQAIPPSATTVYPTFARILPHR